MNYLNIENTIRTICPVIFAIFFTTSILILLTSISLFIVKHIKKKPVTTLTKTGIITGLIGTIIPLLAAVIMNFDPANDISSTKPIFSFPVGIAIFILCLYFCKEDKHDGID